jgi:hypothetical protein
MEEIRDEERKEYIDFLLRQYRLVDALWFLAVEDKFGLEAAVELNEKIWEEMGSRSAKEIKKRFKIQEKGLKGFLKAIKYFPWCIILGYEFEERDGKLLLRVRNCLPQIARIKSGRGEFPCKKMHFMEFSAFCREIDDKISVKCVFAPPDNHPSDCFCLWEFTEG